MIFYILILVFVLLLISKREHFNKYIQVFDSVKDDEIYKGFYKCNEYEDVIL